MTTVTCPKRKNAMRILIGLLSLVLTLSEAQAYECKAPYAYMKDLQTGVVLFEKDAEKPMVPSSLLKIMTAHLVFERLKNGDVKLRETFPVSTKAWKTEGSKMFVKVDSQVPVEELLKGVIVQSGNDACVVLAEGLAGTEEAFAEEMTQKAHDMGATHTTFANATGLPDERNTTTAKDLALIAERTIREYPNHYVKYYPLKEYTYNNITQGNRNSLLSKNVGVDGLKTGHTDAGGYGIVVSAKQGDRRIIMVINGLPTAQARHDEAMALLNWGFNYFKNYKLFTKGAPVETVDVWGGEEKTVPLMAGQDLIVTLPRHQRRLVQAKLIYTTPLAASLNAGTPVGVIEVSIPEKRVQKIPLLVGKDVSRAWFPERLKNSISYLLLGKY